MALDNAQFMSELSITDPPGTDPLSEGDDQIRTSKRTQQQSFPNVDKAVTTTADELNDVALQSQPNAFSASQQFTQPMFLDAANQITDTVFFFRDSIPNGRWDLTMQRVDTSGDFFIRRRDAAGVSLDIPFRITALNGRASFTNLLILESSVQANDGLPSAPTYSFTNNFDMGMYRDASNVLAFATAGVQRMNLTGAAMQVKQPVHTLDGTAGAPAHSFQTHPNLGMYVDAQFDLAFASGQGSGVLIIRVPSGTIAMPFLQSGSAGLSSGDLFESVGAPGFIEIVP